MLLVIAAELYLLSTSTPAHTSAPETNANRENLNNFDFFGFVPSEFGDGSPFTFDLDAVAVLCSTEEAYRCCCLGPRAFLKAEYAIGERVAGRCSAACMLVEVIRARSAGILDLMISQLV